MSRVASRSDVYCGIIIFGSILMSVYMCGMLNRGGGSSDDRTTSVHVFCCKVNCDLAECVLPRLPFSRPVLTLRPEGRAVCATLRM